MAFAAPRTQSETIQEMVERLMVAYPPFKEFSTWLDSRTTPDEKAKIVQAAFNFVFTAKGQPNELQRFVAFHKKIDQYGMLKAPLSDVPIQCISQYGKNGMAVLDAFSVALNNHVLFRNKDINPALVTSIGDLVVASMDAAGPYRDRAKSAVCNYLGNETLSLQDLGPSLTRRFSSVMGSLAKMQAPQETIDLAFALLEAACGNRTLTPALMNRKLMEGIEEVARTISVEQEPFKMPLVELMFSLLNNPQFDVESLTARTVKNLKAVVKSFADAAHYPDLISWFPARVFDQESTHPNATPLRLEFLTPEWGRKVGEVMRYVYEKDATQALSYFNHIMKNRTFSPSMLTRDFAKRLVSLATDDVILNGEISSVLENKPLADAFWDPQLINRLAAFSRGFKKLFEQDTRSGVAERKASLARYLIGILENPSWSMDLCTPGLLNRAYRASNILSRRGITQGQLSTFFSEGSPDVIKFILSVDEKSFEKGVAAARAFGMDSTNPIICLNLAYSIDSIGLAKTSLLHERFGVDYFARYAKHTLEEAARNADPSYNSKKPVFLVAISKEDHGPAGAFYRDHDLIDSLTKYYRVVLVEMRGKKETYERIRQVGSSYGSIPNTLLGAHGATWALFVGKWPGEDATIDVDDAKELASLKRFFAPNPYFLFSACLTGKDGRGIAATFSRVFDATVDASIAVSARPFAELDGQGRLVRGQANEIPLFNNEFVSGKLLDSVPRRVR